MSHEHSVKTYENFVGGRNLPPVEGRTFSSVNPATGQLWGHFAESSTADVDAAVTNALRAFEGPWAKLSPTRRGRLLMRWADKIADNAIKIATIETEQNGKLFAEMSTQARIASDWLYYFGGLADKIEGTVVPLDRTSVFNYTLREPLGVVAVIVPWNSPTLVTVWASAAALAAGNTVVIKPSEYTSASAVELARLAIEAGIPEGVVNVVTGGRETGAALVAHGGVAKINFTGSDVGGREIAAQAGRRLVDCVLELGGKSPNIVFEDAELDRAESGVLAGIFSAAGQTCVAGSRAYIHESIYDQFVDRLVRRTKTIVIGDPMKPETQMGPVANKAQLEKDIRMVGRGVAEGARLLCGGSRFSPRELPGGFFFQPTIVETGSDNYLVQNEVFGPVLTLCRFRDDDEAVTRANDTAFGLAAGMWTRDIRRAHSVARRIKAGTVWINTYRAVAFNSPFGGYKASGIGRQNGLEAVYHYLQTKSVWCELGTEVQDQFVIRT